MEEGDERLEEHRVVEQAVHLLQSWWKAQNFGWEDCLPQRLLRVLNLGAQQRWLQSLRKGTGAIVASFGAERSTLLTQTRSRAIFTSSFSGQSS